MVLPMRRWFRGGSGDERRARRGGGWGCTGNGEAAKPRGENASRRKSEKQSLAEERAGLPEEAPALTGACLAVHDQGPVCSWFGCGF